MSSEGELLFSLGAATAFYLYIPEKVLFTCGGHSCYVFLMHVPCVKNVLFVSAMSALGQGLHEVPLPMLRPEMGILSTLSQ